MIVHCTKISKDHRKHGRGNKYMFDGTTWTANPDWKDPVVVQAELDAERG